MAKRRTIPAKLLPYARAMSEESSLSQRIYNFLQEKLSPEDLVEAFVMMDAWAEQVALVRSMQTEAQREAARKAFVHVARKRKDRPRR